MKRGPKPKGESPMTSAERQRLRRKKAEGDLASGEKTFACEKCGSPMRVQVQAVIEAPAGMMHQFSKSNLARKDVFLRGVLWETADRICTNPDCGHVIDGYGNYVTRLGKRAEKLEQALRLAENTLSGYTPFTTQLAANGKHPMEIISAIRDALEEKA